ncbi:MAG TPA: zf-HC2 domain-containing protein [Roseiflexaceae bacterium]|nr:zf-HC2 domain-containing protein [Roseiflexaceae bacterium]HMP39318.1 zf-HC2 domain-containing protein [Roseiflexaceae bacterium]
MTTPLCECCTASPAMHEAALIAFADGDSNEILRQHLVECACCAARVAEFRTLQQFLRSRLFRALCPTSDDLMNHVLGMLPISQVASFDAHLASCPHCAAELRMLTLLSAVHS